MHTKSSSSEHSLNRRTFVYSAGVSALAALAAGSSRLSAEAFGESTAPEIQSTGNGEWAYQRVSGWGQLPEGKKFGGTHGAIASDSAGNLYVSTQSDTGILVYSSEGKLLRTIATQYPEVHSLFHSTEGGVEYFYATVQKGTPQENWLFIKFKLDGTVVQKIKAPAEAGFKTANEWRITAAIAGPDGSIYIANGYGDSRIFRFDKEGNYKASFSGKGTEDGKCDCSHGLAVDTRYDQPLLLVCDRENFRLSHYDFDGKFVRNVTQHLRRPCQVSFHGDHALVSELQGRVTILDKDNVPVAFLGDNPQHSQWANYNLNPKDISPTVFSAAHGCFIDKDANVYVSDWNQEGRITKLVRSAKIV
jgi:outer membrane protein assembly factor BamB